jgi:hypothetical protein
VGIEVARSFEGLMQLSPILRLLTLGLLGVSLYGACLRLFVFPSFSHFISVLRATGQRA